ncbi:MAG: methionine gamma-lyase family protein [Cyanobacteriota/Melainabacteria group bacterium]
MQDLEKARDLILAKERALVDRFSEIDRVSEFNLNKVLTAFRENRVTQEHFNPASGYGIDHIGRETLDRVWAQIFKTESACVRVSFVSGTHAIACAILGNIRPGTRFLTLTGTPYDSLEPVLGGKKESRGSICDLGGTYLEVDLDPASMDRTEIVRALAPLGEVDFFYLQKSCGYSATRKTYSNKELKKLIDAARSVCPTASVIVDNCYGEFVEVDEPSEVGADLIVGSLIKNPGGGLAIAGGYIAGAEDLVESALIRLTAPGIKGHMGVNFGEGRRLFQGLFIAPSVVAQALKGVLLITSVFEEFGMTVKPRAQDQRYDIIQAIEFSDEKKLINFCRAMQRYSPVDAHVEPEPYRMPGYEDPVVMAGGTFVEGATIELSCDGPLRAPYTAYLQGGLSYQHVKCYLEGALSLSFAGEMPFF